ncbi:MAG: hydantoinase B/oxoprolinase family protein [Acidimicrobiales bacterium]
MNPAALQILITRLTGIAEEMGAVLRRASCSPNIKERADCSAALFTPAGELLVQAEHVPVHLGSMPASVKSAIDVFGERLQPGDQMALNDPFAGGTHLNDLTLVAPCFAYGRLVGWAANRAHHADLGGMAPGSMPADATEIYQEGLRVPPVLFTPEVEAMIVANSRTPDERRGDLDAQRGANVVGVERLAAFADAPLDEVTDYGERRMRAALAAMPDGRWAFEDVIDSCGPRPDQQRPARIVLTLTIDGDTATFDFTGTDAQRPGNMNAVEAVTVSAVSFAIRSATDPTIPANGGAMRPVTVIVPAGSLVAARLPVAVGAGNVEVSQRVADVCLGALATAAPARVGAASQGTMNNTLIGGASWVYYETVAGGQGGRPGRPGMSGVQTGMTNTDQVDYRSLIPTPGQSGIQTGMTNTDQVDYRLLVPSPGQSGIQTGMTNTQNTPIEALERAYGMRVLRYRLRRASGGSGFSPGGEGIERDLQMLEDCTLSLITERRVSQPWGLAGGKPGAVGENWLLRAGDEAGAERLPDKCTVHLRAGDVLRVLTPGGGGWGSPRY